MGPIQRRSSGCSPGCSPMPRRATMRGQVLQARPPWPEKSRAGAWNLLRLFERRTTSAPRTTLGGEIFLARASDDAINEIVTYKHGVENVVALQHGGFAFRRVGA